MKKFLLAAFVGLTIVFATVQAQAAEPAQDTWVLNWEGIDYYVVAGTLEYNKDYGIDVPAGEVDLRFEAADGLTGEIILSAQSKN